ncbi:MAG: hypothetical protein ABIV26_07040, partial [Candidatus Limnocylindrales bacterium]
GDVVDLTSRVEAFGVVNAADPVWAPDGSALTFTYRTDGPSRLALIDPLGGSAARDLGEDGDSGNLPAWSPDGRWIAVIRGLNGGTPTLIDPRGVEADVPLHATNAQEFGPFGWSPRSDWLAYTTVDGGIDAVNVDGSDPIVVVPPEDGVPISFAGWAPVSSR